MKLKRISIIFVAVIILYFVYNFVDKYMNASAAEENAGIYVTEFYNQPPEKATCSSIDTSNTGRVGCTVSIKDTAATVPSVKVLALSCKGRFDMLESGAKCIPTIANTQ